MGPVPIADIGPGTMVLTKDDCGVVSFQPCERQILSENAPLLDLAVEYGGGRVETIETTDKHPFWVLGSGWTRADQLVPGARVDALSGPATVRSLSFASRTTTVYDLTVPVGHSFFVGADGVWVHNCLLSFIKRNIVAHILDERPERQRELGVKGAESLGNLIDRVVHNGVYEEGHRAGRGAWYLNHNGKDVLVIADGNGGGTVLLQTMQ